MDSLEIIVLVVQMVWSFATIFGVCEFGESLSGSFQEINDTYNQLAWYLFPRHTQHMLTTLIMMAQAPAELNVFGSISCCRITLKNVCILN